MGAPGGIRSGQRVASWYFQFQALWVRFVEVCLWTVAVERGGGGRWGLRQPQKFSGLFKSNSVECARMSTLQLWTVLLGPVHRSSPVHHHL